MDGGPPLIDTIDLTIMNTTQTDTDEGLLLATFLLGNGTFGVDARQIQEVARVGEVTPVHHAPACIVGIRNLRGHIVTVLDLRALLEARASPNLYR